MGFLELLTLLFIALKLFGVISWSWWLVLLPEIIAVALYIFIFVAVFIFNLITARSIHKEFKNWRR